MERFWQPRCMYMSINKSGNKIKRNKYMTRAVQSESFFVPCPDRNYSSRWSTPFMSEIKTTTKKSVGITGSVLYEGFSSEKTKNKYLLLNAMRFTWLTVVPPAVGSLALSYQMCLYFTSFSLFFLGEAATIWEKKTWRRKPSEDVGTFILFAFVWHFCCEIWNRYFDPGKPRAELTRALLQCEWG